MENIKLILLLVYTSKDMEGPPLELHLILADCSHDFHLYTTLTVCLFVCIHIHGLWHRWKQEFVLSFMVCQAAGIASSYSGGLLHAATLLIQWYVVKC